MPIYEVRANSYSVTIDTKSEEYARFIFVNELGYNEWTEMRDEYARMLALGQVPRDMCQDPSQLIQVREVG